MITPWLPVISEEKPRFLGENLVLSNPWFTHDRPMIYPWQPVIFSRVRMCPLYTENIAEKHVFFIKNGIPWDDEFERFACSVDNPNFSATVGWPQSTLRILFGANLSIDCLWLLNRIEKRHSHSLCMEKDFWKNPGFWKNLGFFLKPWFCGTNLGLSRKPWKFSRSGRSRYI